MKKISLVSAVLITLPFYAKAWEPCGTDWKGRTANCEYQIDDDGTLTIRGVGDNGNIGRWEKDSSRFTPKLAPWYGENVTNIVIDESIKDLGYEGLWGMTSQKPIVIPSSVTIIGEDAFQNVTAPEVIIPNSVTEIVKWSFSQSQIDKINIPDSVTSIGDYAFYQAKGLSDIVIPDSVISLGSKAFEECTDLKSIVIGDGVTSILGKAFADTPAYIYCQDTQERSCKDLIGENNQEALGKLRLYTVENGKIKVGSKTYDSLSDLPQYKLRRIYTIDEANAAAGDKNRVSIRYR